MKEKERAGEAIGICQGADYNLINVQMRAITKREQEGIHHRDCIFV